MVKMDIIVFKQHSKKEDKKTYSLLNTEDYLKGINTVDKDNINTYNIVRQALANANLTMVKMPLKKLHMEEIDKEEKITNIDGFFELLTVCITDKGTYYNTYVVIKTKIGLTYRKVKANPIILPNNDIIL